MTKEREWGNFSFMNRLIKSSRAVDSRIIMVKTTILVNLIKNVRPSISPPLVIVSFVQVNKTVLFSWWAKPSLVVNPVKIMIIMNIGSKGNSLENIFLKDNPMDRPVEVISTPMVK
jgi:hypothetical protein